MTFGLGEAKLSGWMAFHAYVSWIEHTALWELEAQLMSNLSLPLNLAGNDTHPYRLDFKGIRAAA
jgi:hypothetical protein